MELFPPASTETYAAILSASEIDEESLKSAVKELKLWLETQSHLPHEFDEKILSLFYLRNKKRMGKTKEGLEAFYTMRYKYPEIMCDRDPWKPWFTQASETVYYFALPELTEDHSRVVITGNFHSDISSYKIYDILKLDFMVQDLRILEEFTPFDTLVIDCANTSIHHFTKYTLPLNCKIKSIFIDGLRTRIHSIHIINAPVYLDVTMKLMKFLLKPKLFKRIHVHRELGNLHEFVPARILPNEYGGEAGSVHDIWHEWKQKIVSKREWFLLQEKSKNDVSQSS